MGTKSGATDETLKPPLELAALALLELAYWARRYEGGEDYERLACRPKPMQTPTEHMQAYQRWAEQTLIDPSYRD